MPLRETLTNTWDHIQGFLFPMLREEAGPLTTQHERLVVVLDLARIEAFVRMWPGLPGRPQEDRHALARAFVAKAVLNLATTSGLIERLAVDATLRRLCGWERASMVPDESTFSRAFAEFAVSALPGRVHEMLIKRTHKDRLVGHVSRDATAIDAREKPVKAPPVPVTPKRKRGRPKKGEATLKKEPRRLERQTSMTLAEMLADLPTACTTGTKRTVYHPRAIRPSGARLAAGPGWQTHLFPLGPTAKWAKSLTDVRLTGKTTPLMAISRSPAC